MNYPRTKLGTVSHFADLAEQNRRFIDELFSAQLQRVILNIDIQREIAAQYAWMFDTALAPRREAERTAHFVFERTTGAFFDALELLRRGSFGSARVLLRQAFEALIIAKFCSVSEDETLAIRWQRGEVIYLGKAVFRNVLAPDMAPIEQLWGWLSDYTHAGVHSQQSARWIDEEIEVRETAFTFTYLELLTECAYHVLNSHILRSDMRWYAATYSRAFTVPELRINAKQNFRAARSDYGPGVITLLRTFKRRWTIRSSNAPLRTPLAVRRSMRDS